jgi:copper chaperone CopZ
MEEEKTSKKLLGAGVLAAIAASLCCITPVLALIAGSSGLASTFSWLEPARPYLIGITILVIGFAWYQKLKVKKVAEIDCACEEDEEKKSFLHSKAFLAIVTVFSAFMLSFPYYSGIFFPENNKQIVIIESINDNGIEKDENVILIEAKNLAEVEFDIEGMTCEACNYTVQNASLEVQGVIDSKADFNTGKAVISYDKTKTNEKEIIEAINQTHYDVIEDPQTN